MWMAAAFTQVLCFKSLPQFFQLSRQCFNGIIYCISINSACFENLSLCHIWHACRRMLTLEGTLEKDDHAPYKHHNYNQIWRNNETRCELFFRSEGWSKALQFSNTDRSASYPEYTLRYAAVESFVTRRKGPPNCLPLADTFRVRSDPRPNN